MNNILLRGKRWRLPITLGFLLSSNLVMAVQPQTTPAQFDINGHIEKFTLDPACAAPSSALHYQDNYKDIDPANTLKCTATIVVNGQNITLPANTVITFPATFLTPYETFAWNPRCDSSCTETGLAIQDQKRLPDDSNPATYEASIKGNVVYDNVGNKPQYIAGLVAISQQDLNSAEGFINFIDYTTGEIRVGGDLGDNTTGARIRLNDPVGRFGRSNGPQGLSTDTQDVRFAVDDGNPTVTAETGYPLCIPRTDPNVVADPLCPESNRPLAGGNIPGTAIPAHLGTFAMDCVRNPPPLNTCVQAPAIAPVGFPAVMPGTDPTQQAPLEVGDYIVYAGTRAVDAQGKYISAHTISANLGIYTTPGTDPAYMTQEVSLVGVGTTNGFAAPAEGRELFKIVGFTTDVARPVDTGKLMTDPCDGSEAFVRITTQYPNGSTLDPTGSAAGMVPLGRFRTTFLKGTALATTMRPAVKEIQTQIVGSNLGGALAANGLLYGQYTAPVSEYIFAENLGFGGLPIVPNNFEDFSFLSLGHGPWDLYNPYGNYGFNSPIQGQLNPWPGSPAPASVDCSAGGSAPPIIVASDLIASSGTVVTLNASGSYSLASGAVLNYSWQQVTGPIEVPVNVPAPTSPTLSFTAPLVPLGALPVVLTFDLTVTDIVHLKSSTKTVTVTVNPNNVVDTLSFSATPTYRIKDGSWNVLVGSGGPGANSNAVVSIEATNSAGTVVLSKRAMTHSPGTFAWSFVTKTLVSPLIGNPPPLNIKITSDKGGSLSGSVAVRTN